MAPEVIRGQGYSSSCDWWSSGVIMFECLYGWRPPAIYDASGSTHLTSPLSARLCALHPISVPFVRTRIMHASAVRASMTTSLMTTTTTTAFPERSHSLLAPSSFDPCRCCALCHPHPPRHKPHIKRRVIYAQGHHRPSDQSYDAQNS